MTTTHVGGHATFGLVGWAIYLGGTRLYQRAGYGSNSGGTETLLPDGTIEVNAREVPLGKYDDDPRFGIGIKSIKLISDTADDTRLEATYTLPGAHLTFGFMGAMALDCGAGVSGRRMTRLPELPPAVGARQDTGDDLDFDAPPRLVTHIDETRLRRSRAVTRRPSRPTPSFSTRCRAGSAIYRPTCSHATSSATA